MPHESKSNNVNIFCDFFQLNMHLDNLNEVLSFPNKSKQISKSKNIIIMVNPKTQVKNRSAEQITELIINFTEPFSCRTHF